LYTNPTPAPRGTQSPAVTNQQTVTPVPPRASTIAWCRALAETWRLDALARLKRAQEIRGEASWLRDGPLKVADLAEADRLEREADGLYGSAERWG
jgi:hypothetical protein